MGDYYGPASSSSSLNGDDRKRTNGELPLERGYRTDKRWRRDGESGRRDGDDCRGYDRYNRGDSRGYGDPPRSDAFRDHIAEIRDDPTSWRCLECNEWNHQVEFECQRCRAPPHYRSDRGYGRGDMHYDDRREDRRGAIGDDFGDRSDKPMKDLRHEDDGGQFDEFGRSLAVKPPNKTRWPPSFETGGTAYVFDARSGMFYESNTDFFYDPKSKLYYGNKQQMYFSFNASTKEFDELKASDDTASVPMTALVTDASQSTTGSTSSQSKPISIAIKLKTKELPSSKTSKKSSKSTTQKEKALPASTSSTDAAAMVVAKKHAADLSKWSERQAEKRQEAEPLATDKSPKEKVTTTAKGEPICLLCRRKFPTMEKLQYHEQVSTLHKENLAKQQAEASKKSDLPAAVEGAPKVYVDRAEQRRIMHGVDVATNDLPAALLDSAGSTRPPEVRSVEAKATTQDNLGESNIGNQLLQKLGWKAGDSLGRQQNPSDTDASGEAKLAAAALKQEWDRIESIAVANHAQGQRRSNEGGVGARRNL